MLAIIIETKYTYSVEHNNVFIALVATNFRRYDYRQANAVQNVNGWLHVAHQNVKLYGALARLCQYPVTALNFC
jgi:hypothetical protein